MISEHRGVASEDWALYDCDISGVVENWVQEAGDVWSHTFTCKIAAYLAGEKGREGPRAMPPRDGLRGWLEPVDLGDSATDQGSFVQTLPRENARIALGRQARARSTSVASVGRTAGHIQSQ